MGMYDNITVECFCGGGVTFQTKRGPCSGEHAFIGPASHRISKALAEAIGDGPLRDSCNDEVMCSDCEKQFIFKCVQEPKYRLTLVGDEEDASLLEY